MSLNLRPILVFGFFLVLSISVTLGIILPKSKHDFPEIPEVQTSTTSSTSTTAKVSVTTPEPSDDQVLVSPMNFVRAETDRCMELIRLKVVLAVSHRFLRSSRFHEPTTTMELIFGVIWKIRGMVVSQ